MVKTKALSVAVRAIAQSRKAMENLIDQTPRHYDYTLGLLGPILCELRAAMLVVKAMQENTEVASR